MIECFTTRIQEMILSMVGLGFRTRFGGIPFRGKIGIFLGFTLSLLALILPFYNVEFLGGFDRPVATSAYYWSFKSSAKTYYSIWEIIEGFGLYQPFYVSWIMDVVQASSYPSVCFIAYWFDSELSVGGLSKLVMALFGLQLLTLGTGLPSLFVRRRVVRLVTVMSGVAVVALMLYSSVNPLFEYSGSLRLGFWFAILAEIVLAIDLAWANFRQVSSRLAQILFRASERLKQFRE
jgi:hypothetical protein